MKTVEAMHFIVFASATLTNEIMKDLCMHAVTCALSEDGIEPASTLLYRNAYYKTQYVQTWPEQRLHSINNYLVFRCEMNRHTLATYNMITI